ncbi:hypothetical protein PHLCEN_2v3688 [Hermanssonia centrifuga]|uniref:Uncharacterized protein n=1 Tax=Hermanssonia centrifuga TaxID=98765 RepID=A0A2R6QEI3_9APHY|nr:hypothetical protein PHLCEN_2v3688 [Hermanssonia centrifuga]
MSGSGWFDMFTGVVSLVVVFCGMLQQLLPSTWLSLLEDSLKDVETSIRVAGEEGLLPIDTALFIRLTELRRDFDQLAVRVYAAGNWFQQFLEMLKGLTCKLSVVHKSVSAVKAEIAIWIEVLESRSLE